MSNALILREALLFEGEQLLKETCSGLSANQRTVIQNIVSEFQPLIEATLRGDQLNQLFRYTVQQANAPAQSAAPTQQTGADSQPSGAADPQLAAQVKAKAEEVVGKVKQWIQNTTPVQDFEARFARLKSAITDKLGNSSILVNWTQKFGNFAKANPGKTAAVLGVLTAVASMVGSPAGKAVAGQVLRGSADVLKGAAAAPAQGNQPTGPAAASKRESVEDTHLANVITEEYAQMLFATITEGLWDNIKNTVSNAAAKTATAVKTNFAKKVTYDDLMSAWVRMGRPTDSQAVFDFLVDQGIDKDTVSNIYAELKLTTGSDAIPNKSLSPESAELVDRILKSPREVQYEIFAKMSTIFNPRHIQPAITKPTAKSAPKRRL